MKPNELRDMSVEDLTTLGERDLGGAVVRSFSAHPHWVPERRAAYNFGVNSYTIAIGGRPQGLAFGAWHNF